jgi:ribose/xylose/arabinose/galactoside ABC-type transport system permease subunit
MTTLLNLTDRAAVETATDYFPWILLFIIYIVAGVGLPNLLSLNQIEQVLVQSTPVILLAIGLGFCLIVGEFDLSIIGVLTFAPLVGLHLINEFGLPPALGFVAIVFVGLIIGSINGVLITKLGIPSLILTLATWWILEGAVLSITGGRTVANIPNLFRTIGIGDVVGLRYLVIIALITAFLAWYFSVAILQGRRLFLVGGDADACLRLGIDVDQQKILAFALSGAFAALAGVLLVSRVGSLSSGTGSELLMPAIAAPVIAGVSLFGGTGKVINIIAGAILVRALLTIVRVAGVSGTEFQMVQGILVLIVILVMEGRIRHILTEKFIGA